MTLVYEVAKRILKLRHPHPDKASDLAAEITTSLPERPELDEFAWALWEKIHKTH